MSNVGKEYPSEMRTYTDPKTGREIIQLTASGSNGHLYFTPPFRAESSSW